MKFTLFFPTRQDYLKEKVTIFGIWLIALLLPLFTLKFMFLGKILIPHTLYPYEDEIYFLVLVIISIGLIVRSNMMRRVTLLILYLSMLIILTEHIEESMRIFEGSGCTRFFKGYGIDYASLIYPQKILKFMTIFVLILLIHIILIYILSNKESYKLYKTSQIIYWKETLTLILFSTIITIFFLISLIKSPMVIKTYPQNLKKNILPIAKPFKIYTYESLGLPKKALFVYKVRFKDKP